MTKQATFAIIEGMPALNPEAITPQPVLPQPFVAQPIQTPKKRFNIRVFILLLALLFSVILIVYLYFLWGQKTEVDILSFTGWRNIPAIRISNNSLDISNDLGSTELRIPNPTDSVDIGPNGFEVSVKTRTETSPNPIIAATGSIVLYNGNPREPDTKRLEIGLTNKGYLSFVFVDPTKNTPEERVITFIAPQTGYPIIKLDSDNLKIKVTNTNNKTNEVWNIYNGETKQLLAENITLPTLFLKEGNKLFFGFYVVSGSRQQVATLAISEFKFIKK